jgi:uncharacterized repeat protein (TIGR01451 family)
MFKKIVSNLSFSPALVGQLGFYAKRLKKEETTRRLGLVFVALALIVQCMAVFQPPQSANASAAADLVSGGLGLGSNRSLNNFLAPYDANVGHLQDIYNFAGITRQEIVDSQYGTFLTAKNDYDFGRIPDSGTTPVTITDATGTKNLITVYAGSITVLNGTGTRIYGWIGHSAKAGWFAIMQACGNLVLNSIPKPPTPPPPAPANIVQSKTATNITQGKVNATTVAAAANDIITYTITLTNNGGSTSTPIAISDYLGDVLQYSTLSDNGGGTFNTTTQFLSWPDVTLKAGETQTRTFGIQVLSTIPATPQGLSDKSSYDCLMQNTLGPNITVTIPVTCAPPKVIETVTTQLPHTGPTENMIFAGVVLAVVTYFFLRSKQLGQEVRLIRRDLNSGTI